MSDKRERINLSINNIPQDLLASMLENPYESLILVDADGIIKFMSSYNESVYNIKIKDVIGRPIKEIIPNTRLPEVLKSGKAEIGESMVIRKKQRVISRIPLKQNGRIVGATGKMLFLHPERLKQLYNKIDTLEHHLDYYKAEFWQRTGSKYCFDNIIGNSEPLKQCKTLAKQAASTNSSVIIIGESGTGKELFAHSIHNAGSRREHPFVSLNCSSIPEELIESELFGYEPGSFTGAAPKGKIGKFEMADKGTIFLDEIGDMSLRMQVKLLRVLQDKEIEKIGISEQIEQKLNEIDKNYGNL